LTYTGLYSKRDFKEKDVNKDPVAFKIAAFAWKEDYKAMRVRKDRYRDNKLNVWALIYDQCSPVLKKSWKEQRGMRRPKRPITSYNC
jgi:hypothetical protein